MRLTRSADAPCATRSRRWQRRTRPHGAPVGARRLGLGQAGRGEVARLARRRRRADARPSTSCARWPPRSAPRSSRTRCCSAWAARACARKCSPRTFGSQPGTPRAARARLDRPGAGARRREPRRPRAHARHRRQQVRQHARAERLQTVLLRAHGRRRRPRRRRRGTSSPSPIPDRSCRRSPRATASVTSCSASRRSADATRRCRRSGWCPRR